MPICIEPYSNEEHRDSVVQLWKNVFAYESLHNDPEISIDKKLEMNDGLFFVALEDEKLRGTIMAGYDGHRGWIYSLAVHPEKRRQGTGRKLLEHVEAVLRQKGCAKMNLQVMPDNAEAVAFYRAYGFTTELRTSMGKVLD